MCGRFTLAVDKEALEKRFGLKLKGRWEPRFNVAPEQTLPVVWNPGRPEFIRQAWGMRPVWWSHGARSLINIRVETLKTKPTFKRLVAQQRCLMPADGFYEWQKSSRVSQPYRFSLNDGGIFSFPALWEHEVGPGGEERLTFAFITVPPNPLVAQVHDRMPCILEPPDEEAWLDPALAASAVLDLCYAFPAAKMQAVPVSRAVNSPAVEGPSLIRRDGQPLKNLN